MAGSKHVILFLAPQPFYQERGTPIAVKMALESLAAITTPQNQPACQIQLLTYHEGFDISIEGVTHHRMWAPKWLCGIRPGVSIKKLIADVFYTFSALKLLITQKYDSIHAVEEAVFIALPVAFLRRKPIVYDMDSSLAHQLLERWGFLKILAPAIYLLEKIAIRSSQGVLAVCDELVLLAKNQGGKVVSPLYDISLLEEQSAPTQEDLRITINAPSDARLILYVGNLETYQGVDLLIESMAHIDEANSQEIHCIIVGGNPSQIEKYSNIATKLNVSDRVHLIGPRPLAQLGSYLTQATVLASPRIKGNNTPMKLYSYLDSGVPVVATDLTTHTQAMTQQEGFLAAPSPEAYAQALQEAINHPEVASLKCQAAKELVKRRYTKTAFNNTLSEFYRKIFNL